MAAVGSPVVPDCVVRPASSRSRLLRLSALAVVGLSIGAAGSLLTVSWVQAEGGMDMLANARNDHNRREAARRSYYPTSAPVPAPRSAYSGYVSSYAPVPPRPVLSNTNDRGQISLPYLDLNPFRMDKARNAAERKGRKAKSSNIASASAVGHGVDTVSGSANTARSICVRLCDGFHAPIGYLNSAADLPAHEALCKAMNPGVPVKAFRVPAGATTIDGAVSSDGKTYGALSVAYSHEKTADPACRPKVVGFKERRISVLKDFTLRPGDTVVTETGARVFNGGSRYPYASADFRDFRQSDLITNSDRKRIDHLVGVSRGEQARRQARNALLLQEASAGQNIATDVIYSLRGSLDDAVSAPGTVRVVQPSPFNASAR